MEVGYILGKVTFVQPNSLLMKIEIVSRTNYHSSARIVMNILKNNSNYLTPDILKIEY